MELLEEIQTRESMHVFEPRIGLLWEACIETLHPDTHHYCRGIISYPIIAYLVKIRYEV